MKLDEAGKNGLFHPSGKQIFVGSLFPFNTDFSPLLLLGGAAEQSGNIETGDEILAVSGKSLIGLMHYDAWNIIKSVPEGPVQLLIRKHRTAV